MSETAACTSHVVSIASSWLSCSRSSSGIWLHACSSMSLLHLVCLPFLKMGKNYSYTNILIFYYNCLSSIMFMEGFRSLIFRKSTVIST